MWIPPALKGLQRSVKGAAKAAWIRSLNVYRKAVGRIFPEPSICEI
jgi:hypothetical protein